jgi:hypothetical protein
MLDSSTSDLMQLGKLPPLDQAALNEVQAPPTPWNLPDEPTTLALGLVGVGIIGVYAGLKRWARRSASRATVAGGVRELRPGQSTERKRGAA